MRVVAVHRGAPHAAEHLRRFHANLVAPLFAAFPDELEDVAVWLTALRGDDDDDDVPPYVLCAALAYDDDATTVEQEHKQTQPQSAPLLGGVVGEYYPISNCALITYLAVAERARRGGVARCAMGHLVADLHTQARSRAFPNGDAHARRVRNAPPWPTRSGAMPRFSSAAPSLAGGVTRA